MGICSSLSPAGGGSLSSSSRTSCSSPGGGAPSSSSRTSSSSPGGSGPRDQGCQGPASHGHREGHHHHHWRWTWSHHRRIIVSACHVAVIFAVIRGNIIVVKEILMVSPRRFAYVMREGMPCARLI